MLPFTNPMTQQFFKSKQNGRKSYRGFTNQPTIFTLIIALFNLSGFRRYIATIVSKSNKQKNKLTKQNAVHTAISDNSNRCCTPT